MFAEEDSPMQRLEALAGAAPMNILIADDHELVSEMLKMTLERQPHTRVQTVRNFDDAVRVAGTKRYGAAEPFDLVLLDMRMPGMNGLSGLRRMRDLIGRIPVAIISGMLTPAEARQVMHEGAAAFVPKTLPLEELVHPTKTTFPADRLLPR